MEVLKRDRFTCAYCGNHPPNVLLEVDHVIPVAAGGSDAMENLVTACWDCNRGKADRLLEEGTAPAMQPATLEAMAERLEQAKAYMELLNGLQAVTDKMIWRVLERWAQAWQAELIEDEAGTTYKFPEGSGGQFPDRPSIRRFLNTLSLEVVLEAVDETAARREAGRYWPGDYACRYFYAICWARIKKIEGRE
jgi:hypothetical protein